MTTLNTLPLISVIMPVYNIEKYLSEAIESILNQTFSDFEFLIIDDCSTDTSLAIVKKYQKKDSRIRLFKRSANVGITKNLNYLLSQAKGDYIARMDGDDISSIDRFKVQNDYLLANNNVDLVWTAGDIIDEEGMKICSLYKPKQDLVVKLLVNLKRNYIAHPSVMYRRSSVYHKLNGYNELYRSGQDGELWQRMLSNNMKLHRIDNEFIRLRSRSSSITAQRTNRSNDENIRKAKVCLNNRQYNDALVFIKKVRQWKNRVILSLRYCLGEEIVDFICFFRARISYQEKHKFKQQGVESDVVEI